MTVQFWNVICFIGKENLPLMRDLSKDTGRNFFMFRFFIIFKTYTALSFGPIKMGLFLSGVISFLFSRFKSHQQNYTKYDFNALYNR